MNKPKGKGKSTPTCWQCGVKGHTIWNCPQNAGPYSDGKGKGKSFKGKGKGTYEVDADYAYDCNWAQQFNPSPNEYSESDQGFGGGDIGEVTPWSVVVRKSRGA